MAVKPILASTLVTKQEIRLEDTARTRLRVGCGCAGVDGALDGGLVYGQDALYNISGPTGSQAAETMSLQFLITHVLSSAANTAILIDATGNFDVLKLYRLMLTRLSTTGGDHEANVTQATTTLDRIKIMRVFDYEGVIEGLDEAVDDLEGKIAFKSTIRDSQEDEDEMLELSFGEDEKVERRQAKAGMILVNNLSQVLSLTLKNDYAQGQATITNLAHRLRNMATQHNLCVILLSWSVTHGSEQEGASVFGAIKARPGLGKTLGYLVDTQMLIDAIPRNAQAKGTSDLVNVIEVLHSTGNHQTGNFGVFDMTAEGEIKCIV